MKKRHAFTLIEMLVVMAIIGIIAALVVNMAGRAKNAQHAAQVKGDMEKLKLFIEEYQSKLNYYPPDNGGLATYASVNPSFAYYDAVASTNPLLYELTGATNNPTNTGYGANTIMLFDTNGPTASSNFYGLFVRQSVANSSTEEPHSFYIPQPKEYTNYVTNAPYNTLNGLLVPVSLALPGPNFWHYDSSSTNRHNLNSYDLWAEYYVATKGTNVIIATNGNW